MKRILFISLAFFLFSCSNQQRSESEWIQLFNGKDLHDWVIKFNHHDLNENYRNTFKVKDGKLVVDYSEYDSIVDEFGHIYFNRPFSKYHLKVEYRFTGEQVKGGPGWAYRNNGIMFHSQAPETVLKEQKFPVSIEAQLLGGDMEGERSNGNVCTPGTHIVMDDQLITNHCTNSGSGTNRGDEWVNFELIVYGDSIIHHIVEGDTVLSYSRPQVGGDLPEGFPLPEGFALTEGYIALQAESHPTEFRKIEIKELH